jgi:hypothetical protein
LHLVIMMDLLCAMMCELVKKKFNFNFKNFGSF